MKNVKKKSRNGWRKLKGNTSIPSAIKIMENRLGLPEGSIKLVYPTGRKARCDSTINTLRKHYQQTLGR